MQDKLLLKQHEDNERESSDGRTVEHPLTLEMSHSNCGMLVMVVLGAQVQHRLQLSVTKRPYCCCANTRVEQRLYASVEPLRLSSC